MEKARQSVRAEGGGRKNAFADFTRKATSKKGKRLEKEREPKLVEEGRKSLVLAGGKTSQAIKDAMSDMSRLLGDNCKRFSRNNPECQPFEVGGEVSLEFLTTKNNCGAFIVGKITPPV